MVVVDAVVLEVIVFREVVVVWMGMVTVVMGFPIACTSRHATRAITPDPVLGHRTPSSRSALQDLESLRKRLSAALWGCWELAPDWGE